MNNKLNNIIDGMADKIAKLNPFGYGDKDDYYQDAQLKILQTEAMGYGSHILDEDDYVKYNNTTAKSAMVEASKKYNAQLTCSPTTSYFIHGIHNNSHLSDSELSRKYKISEDRVRKYRNINLNSIPIHENIPSGNNSLNFNEYVNKDLLPDEQREVLNYLLDGYNFWDISGKMGKNDNEIRKIYLSLIDHLKHQNRQLLED